MNLGSHRDPILAAELDVDVLSSCADRLRCSVRGAGQHVYSLEVVYGAYCPTRVSWIASDPFMICYFGLDLSQLLLLRHHRVEMMWFELMHRCQGR